MDPNKVIFRRARREDLPAIVALLTDDDLGSLREEPGLPLAEEYQTAFQKIEVDPNQFLVVAVHGSHVLGTCPSSKHLGRLSYFGSGGPMGQTLPEIATTWQSARFG